MRFRSPFTFKLRQLILLLAITATAAILFSGLYISYQVQKERVIEDTLQSNHVFASKLASAANHFLIEKKRRHQWLPQGIKIL